MIENPELTKRILSRWEQLKEMRQPHETTWKDCATYAAPYRQLFAGDGVTYKPQDRKLYDGTALVAKNLLGDGLYGYMVSPNVYWMLLLMRDEQLMELPGVRAWLQAVERRLYSLFATSSFYPEVRIGIDDAASFGTTVMSVDETPDGVRYATVPIDRIWIAEGKDGPDTAVRKFALSARILAAEFGMDAAPNLERTVKDRPEERFQVLHATFPNDDYDPEKKSNRRKKYSSVYLLEAGNILREGGTDRFRYAAWRYKRIPDTPYGIGPTEEGLSDIKTANLIGKDLLAASNLAVRPPLETAAENRGFLKLNPGALNYYQDPNRRTYAIPIVGTYPIGQEREQAIQARIRDYYHVEFFMLLSQASATRTKTATEVVELLGEKAAVMGSITGSLSTDYLSPIIDITYDIEMKAGRLPPPPPALMQAVGAKLDVDYIGPLPQAQKRYLATRGLTSGLAQVLPLSQFMPEILDNIDFDASAHRLLEESGAPQEAILDPMEVQKLRAARAQQKAALMQAQLAMESAKAYPGLTKAPDPGSPAEATTKQGGSGWPY